MITNTNKPNRKTPNTHRITFRLPLHQFNVLERECISTGATHSNIIRQLIDDKLD